MGRRRGSSRHAGAYCLAGNRAGAGRQDDLSALSFPTMNSFASYFTYRPDTQMLPVGIAPALRGDRLVQFGQMAAASLTGMIPVYLVALFFSVD